MSEVQSVPSSRDSAEGLPREVRLIRALDEYLRRRAGGERLTPATFLAERADLAPELSEHLGLVAQLQPAERGIEELIAQGVLSPAAAPYLATFGAYRIMGYLGRGGMGIVFKAYEESLNRTVALKLLRPELADDQASLTRFEREAKAAAALRHPNIVTVHAIGRERGVPFIAMEYVEGPSLADVIRKHGGARGLPPAFVDRVMGELLAGLGAAHEAGLIHRDIKSSNILLDVGLGNKGRDANAGADPGGLDALLARLAERSGGAVKIVDFGLARICASQTRITLKDAVIGTPEYMSPEQARGAEVDQRTDLYSAGVVLYELLTGKTPFRADSPTATLRRIIDEAPQHPQTLLAGTDPVLASVALRLLAKEPDDRFASATAARAALAAGRPVRVPSIHGGRKRARWGLAFVAVCCGAAALAWALRTPLPITQVRIDEAESGALEVRRGDRPDWHLFYPLGPAVTRFAAAVTLDSDGDARKDMLVVGPAEPHAGANLFCLGAVGQEELWRHYLAAGVPWGSTQPNEPWDCNEMVAGDLDGRPGDELVVTAHHETLFPTCVAMYDPRTSALRGVYWHHGHLSKMVIHPDYFGPGQPAIVCWGCNNRPNDTPRPAQDGDAPLTPYCIVQGLFVLDPAKLTVTPPPPVAPPSNAPPAGLYAYALVSMPMSEISTCPPEPGRPVISADPRDYVLIDRADPVRIESPDSVVVLRAGLVRATAAGGALLMLDRDLAVCRVEVVSGEEISTSHQYWRDRWRVVVQGGQFTKLP